MASGSIPADPCLDMLKTNPRLALQNLVNLKHERPMSDREARRWAERR